VDSSLIIDDEPVSYYYFLTPLQLMIHPEWATQRSVESGFIQLNWFPHSPLQLLACIIKWENKKK